MISTTGEGDKKCEEDEFIVNLLIFYGNPWPTIILEAASSETLRHAIDKCLKFCRTASLQQNPNTTRFGAIEEWITIDCNCIFSGCSQPLSSVPLHPQSSSPFQRPGVAFDLYDIQQAIFRAMGSN
ncbi:unnamed protein product [Rhizophagus irregularis]|nr:unnamed protein product [Rhizophagus irregularis]